VSHRGHFIILRHGETVYNAARIIQSNHIHTPLTALGVEQALAMGKALAQVIDRQRTLLHISDSGRALQTASLICEATGLDFFTARRDRALWEIDTGDWSERSYDDIEAEIGPIIDDHMLLAVPPGGEDYPAIAARLANWLDTIGDDERTHLVVMHGISSRVLRGMLTGAEAHQRVGVPIASRLAQGSIAEIRHGKERVLLDATGM
jgi:broad specificity phosphatase PhoE